MKFQINSRLLIIVFFFLAGLIWHPMIVFFVPGFLILFFVFSKEIDFSELLIYIIGLSLSYWMVFFWLLKYVPISFSNFIILSSVVSFIIGIYFLVKKNEPYKISFSKKTLLLIAVFIFIGFLRFAPYIQLIAPTGADMSWHSTLTQLIVNKNGVPDNYYPALNIDTFNSFPSGFHTISAAISILGNLPGYKGAFIVTCLTYLVLSLFLYLLLKKFTSWPFALASAIAFSFFTLTPQGFSNWGGNPTAFAVAFLIFFIALIERAKENNWFIVFSAFALASVFLSHTVIFVESAYVFGISFLVFLVLKKEYKNFAFLKYFLILAVFILLCLPYLISADFGAGTAEIQNWIRGWNIRTLKINVTTVGFWDMLFKTLKFTVNYVFGIFRYIAFPLSFLGIFLLWRENWKKALQYLIFAILCIALIVNVKYWALPLSYLIYPERTAVLIIIPMAVFFAFSSEKIFVFLKNYAHLSEKGCQVLVCLMLFLVLAATPAFNQADYIKEFIKQNSVTKEDLKAITWLKDNTNPQDIIDNNYGDAGLWIYPIASRRITTPHVNIMYLGRAKPNKNPSYVYIGKKCVYGCPLKDEDFIQNPNYQKVYSEDGVSIYKILN